MLADRVGKYYCWHSVGSGAFISDKIDREDDILLICRVRTVRNRWRFAPLVADVCDVILAYDLFSFFLSNNIFGIMLNVCLLLNVFDTLNVFVFASA